MNYQIRDPPIYGSLNPEFRVKCVNVSCVALSCIDDPCNHLCGAILPCCHWWRKRQDCLIHKAFPRSIPSVTSQSKITSPRRSRGKMRYNKASLVYVFMLLGASLLCASANLQRFSRSESSISNGGRSNNFNYRRVPSHGFRLHGNHDVPDEEQKRLTPNGANPLHNWWDGARVKFKDFDGIHVQNALGNPYFDHQLAGRVSEASCTFKKCD